MSEAFQQSLLTAIPIIIASIASAIVTVRQGNRASAKTDARVDARAGEVKDKLGEVHEKVNGNLSTVTDELSAVRRENIDLREQLARLGSKRSTDQSG